MPWRRGGAFLTRRSRRATGCRSPPVRVACLNPLAASASHPSDPGRSCSAPSPASPAIPGRRRRVRRRRRSPRRHADAHADRDPQPRRATFRQRLREALPAADLTLERQGPLQAAGLLERRLDAARGPQPGLLPEDRFHGRPLAVSGAAGRGARSRGVRELAGGAGEGHGKPGPTWIRIDAAGHESYCLKRWSGVNDCEHEPLPAPRDRARDIQGLHRDGVCDSAYVDRGPGSGVPHPPAGRDGFRVVIDAGVKVRVVSGFRGRGAEGD